MMTAATGLGYALSNSLMGNTQHMQTSRIILAFLASAVITHLLAAIFYTQQILYRQAEIGAVYTPAQTLETYFLNIIGLAPSYGLVLAISLVLAFLAAGRLKRVLVPLAPIAYPLAGSVAVFAVIFLIENTAGRGGVGAIGGARGTVGLLLQCFAGLIGGSVFALVRPR